MIKLSFLASYNGSSAKAIADTCKIGALPASPLLLITNNPNAGALSWAKDAGLKTAVINAKNSENPDQTMAGLIEDHAIDMVICSGYMKLIGPELIRAAHGAVLNIHPALLPKHGGHGMYGRHVHQSVFDAKETETGITIHLVDGEYDRGRILAQKKIPVSSTDTVEDIEHRVREAEPGFYIETLEKILSGNILLPFGEKEEPRSGGG